MGWAHCVSFVQQPHASFPHTTMASVKKAVAESDGVCAEAKVSEAALKKEAAQTQKSVAATPIVHTPPRSTHQTSAVLKQTTIKTCEPFCVTSGFVVSAITHAVAVCAGKRRQRRVKKAGRRVS